VDFRRLEREENRVGAEDLWLANQPKGVYLDSDELAPTSLDVVALVASLLAFDSGFLA